MGQLSWDQPGERLAICIRLVLINMSPCSPAQGAMYAPLALQFVFSESPISFEALADFSQSSCRPNNGESFDDESYDAEWEASWGVLEITHRRYYRGRN